MKQTRIKRRCEVELNTAIAALEARGYVLVNRSSYTYLQKGFAYQGNSRTKQRYTGSELHTRHWAVMRKEESK